jgi:hypothetical protein
MQISQISQRERVWKSKDHSPLGNTSRTMGAMDSLFVGNNKNDHFTSQYSNVW